VPPVYDGRALATAPIVATDTAFSSNSFAWIRQVNKFGLQVEPKEAVMNQLHASRLLKSSHPLVPALKDVAARAAFPDNQRAGA
jgi:hypothetical protein